MTRPVTWEETKKALNFSQTELKVQAFKSSIVHYMMDNYERLGEETVTKIAEVLEDPDFSEMLERVFSSFTASDLTVDQVKSNSAEIAIPATVKPAGVYI